MRMPPGQVVSLESFEFYTKKIFEEFIFFDFPSDANDFMSYAVQCSSVLLLSVGITRR